MPNTQQRDLALDGLRGLAILMVLCVHYFRFEPENAVWVWVNNLCRSGWLGVDLFFCLSGFLITRLLVQDREEPHRLRNFYMRRVLRILPAYYFVLMVVFLVLRREELEGWALPLLFFYQNLAIIDQQSFQLWHGIDPMWSLAVEEQFYLFWPLLLYWTPLRRAIPLCLGVIVMAWAVKLGSYLLHWQMTFYFLTPARMDALGAGALAALLWQRRDEAWRGWQLLRPCMLLLLALLAMLFLHFKNFGIHRPWLVLLASTLAAPAFALLVLAASMPARFPWLCRGLANRVLVFFGRYSYGLYLVHTTWSVMLRPQIQLTLQDHLSANGAMLASGLVITALALGSAVLLYHGLEAPILKLKRHFTPARQAGTIQVSGR